MFTQPGAVEVKCKKCGKLTPSNEFTLDPVYRMMVCRKCVAERRLKESPIQPGQTAVSVRPQGALPARQPVAGAPAVRPQPGLPAARREPGAVAKSSDKMKQKCKKCGFSFLYDAEKGYPLNCPNCGTPTQGKYQFF